MKSIAIMQPYFFPHIGYFQLISAVELFIFYDDVNFIKRGWINRNYISINKQLKRFTVPVKKASRFKKINEVEIDWDSKDMNKLIKTFRLNFSKRSKSREFIENIVDVRPFTISEAAILSIELSCKHLGISTKLEKSSKLNYKKQKDKVLNLVEICKLKKIKNYINAEGGQLIYSKKDFLDYGINLKFLKGLNSASILEIIDSEETKDMLHKYEYL
tara:strand:- start:1312 stop:1959 length:648 start_codon:yes stop_codon:yes gene_type:complete